MAIALIDGTGYDVETGEEISTTQAAAVAPGANPTLGGPGPHWSTIGPTAGSTPGTPGFDGSPSYPSVTATPNTGGSPVGYTPGSYTPPATSNGGGAMAGVYNTAATGFIESGLQPGAEGYDLDIPVAEAITRDMSDEELASYRLNQIIGDDSPLMQRAAQIGRDEAGARGLYNFSIAGGNAMGAMIDRATPLALNEAGAYQRTASENMAAQNSMEALNATNELQGNLAVMQTEAERNAAIRDFYFGSATDARRAGYNVENREDTQRYATGERIGAQDFQKFMQEEGFNFQAMMQDDSQAFNLLMQSNDISFQQAMQADSQAFQTFLQANGFSHEAMMQQSAQGFNASLANLNAQLTMAGFDQERITLIAQSLIQERANAMSMLGGAAAAIYQNPDMTAGEQFQAVTNLPSMFNPIFNNPDYALDLPSIFGPSPTVPLLGDPLTAPAPIVAPPSTVGPTTPAPNMPVVTPPPAIDPVTGLPIIPPTNPTIPLLPAP